MRRATHWGTRRRKVALGALVLAGVVIGTAWAVLSAVKTTAPETITAKSVGGVDIGDAETVGLFAGSLSGIEPGFTITECTTAQVVDRQPGDKARVYFTGAGGELADDIIVDLSANGGSEAPPGNSATCPEGTLIAIASGITLADLLANHNTYETGFDFKGGGSTQLRLTLTLPAGVDPEEVAGESAELAGVFENRST